MKKVQYKWVQYLCEFLANCCKAHEDNKLFHYAWLLLSILLVTCRFPEDSQFLPLEEDLPEAAKFASLWSTKDLERIKESKILLILMEMDLQIVISQRLRFSPTLFEQLRVFAEFKADFHNVSIRVRKDTRYIW